MIVAAVLLAAALHASWNAIAKAIPDRLVASAAIGCAHLVAGALAAALLPVPARGAWPFLLASAVLQTGYLLLLTGAYRHGEFSRVYPLARGTAPVLVTLASLGVLGERLTLGQLVGIALVCAALGTLVLLGGRPRRGDGLGLATATGVVIAAYTLVDGIGVRHAGGALAYVGWLFLLQGPILLTACRLLSGPGFARALVRHARPGALAGVLSFAAYGIVVWAQSVGNLALVSALRETSVLFAGVIGALFFAERFSRARLAVTGLAVFGIVLIEVVG